jgi:molybdopterin/thiamine biosynthesis adenylyltransferase/rhodanese-related sulfurtransferase
MSDKLTEEELIRYSRHLVLKDFGLENQIKLKNARVLVVGAGGLGSPALLYLAAAGVGTLGIVDFDTVALSNLQRQVLFTQDDVGKNKAEAAEVRLHLLNPLIHFQKFPFQLTASNALNVIGDFDVVLDGTDNFPTRYLLNDACVLLNKPLVYGSILQFEGQVAVFNLKNKNGSFSTNYRDLFPVPPHPDSVQNCEQAGVLGVLPGIIGSMQANEVIKIITNVSKPLTDKLVIFDAIPMEITTIAIPNRNSRDSIKSLINYEDFCGINQKNNKSLGMKEITVQELEEMKNSGVDFQLIDVREPYEFDICNLEGELIPMSDIPNNVDKISKDKKVVVHCRSGKRSSDMIVWLEKTHGFTNLYNLKGGVLAWAREIDTDMPTY